MRFLWRPHVFKTAMIAVLFWGNCGVGYSETAISDSDIQQIRDTFSIPIDDRGEFRISKQVLESEELPTEVEGLFVREPYLYADDLCVLETYRKLGTQKKGVIQWRDDSGSLSFRYWLTTATPKKCDASGIDDEPIAVHVNDRIDKDLVHAIMKSERGLILQAIARLDGAQFGEWVYSGISEISSAEWLEDEETDGPFYGASYSLPFRAHGPIVYFRQIDGQFQIVKVGSWMF